MSILNGFGENQSQNIKALMNIVSKFYGLKQEIEKIERTFCSLWKNKLDGIDLKEF